MEVDGDTGTMEFFYDRLDRTEEIIVPGNSFVTYCYDNLSRIQSIFSGSGNDGPRNDYSSRLLERVYQFFQLFPIL